MKKLHPFIHTDIQIKTHLIKDTEWVRSKLGSVLEIGTDK